jgi:hypothetical protein
MTTSRLLRVVCAAAITLMPAACDTSLNVTSPDIIDAASLDPSNPLTIDVFARSAQTTFGASLGDMIRFGGLFTTEMQYVDTFEPESQFGVRSVSVVNLSVPATLWGPVSVARVQADRVHEVLRTVPDRAANLSAVRAATFAGYSMIFMAETFCQGTLANVNTTEPGPVLTMAQVLDSAISRFTDGIDLGTSTGAAPQLTAAVRAEATSLANLARVGRARAHLQKGEKSSALADANAVPAGFAFSMTHVDDASNRTRVSNRIWQFTQGRGQLSVAPAYRALNDPRITFLQPSSSLPAVDGSPLFAQQKYPAYSSPVRVASRLEADYIAAEAQYPTNTAPMLALIATRRAAGNQGAYTGSLAPDSLLAELIDQRARDFYMEGKRLGDLRRVVEVYGKPATLLRLMLPTGSAYFTRTALGSVGSQTCVPLPQIETSGNPNFSPD